MSKRQAISQMAKEVAKDSMVTDVVAKLVEQICLELHDYYAQKAVEDHRKYVEAARGLPVYMPPSMYDEGREAAAKAVEALAPKPS